MPDASRSMFNPKLLILRQPFKTNINSFFFLHSSSLLPSILFSFFFSSVLPTMLSCRARRCSAGLLTLCSIVQTHTVTCLISARKDTHDILKLHTSLPRLTHVWVRAWIRSHSHARASFLTLNWEKISREELILGHWYVCDSKPKCVCYWAHCLTVTEGFDFPLVWQKWLTVWLSVKDPRPLRQEDVFADIIGQQASPHSTDMLCLRLREIFLDKTCQ